MKKLFVFFALALLCATASAQQQRETVYLKNGSVIKGQIIEEVPGKSLKIQTSDGSIFVYEMEDVERITKTTVEATQDKGGHKGLDFNIDLGYDIATKKNANGAFAAQLTLGKRFNKNFYAGIGSGANIYSGGGGTVIPVFTNFKALFPSRSSDIVPLIGLKLGYAFSTKSNFPNCFHAEIMPGVQIPLSKSTDFNLGIGYMHLIPSGGGEGSGAIAIKAGFGFHKSDKPKKPKKIIPKRDKGLQLTIEGSGINPWNMSFGDGDDMDGEFTIEDGGKEGYSDVGINAVIGYKMSPNICFGVGLGLSAITCKFKEEDSYDDEIYSQTGYAPKLFLRGQYRLNDKKLSPFVSVDLGMRYRWHNGEGLFCDDDSRSIDFHATPSVGLSLRTTNNSYLEFKVGYELCPNVSGGKVSYSRTSFDDAKMSGVKLSIGWSRTLKMFSE